MVKKIYFYFSITLLHFPVFSGDISTNPYFTGKVIETDSKIIIEGGTFIMNGETNSAIKLNKGSRKEVIISNVRILSNNQNIRDSTGTGGVVAIDNSTSTARVTVRNVDSFSRNATITSETQGKNACAGIICINAGINDTIGAVGVMATGNTSISSVSGERPDYRKIK